MNTPWNDARTAVATEMLARGETHAAISARLGGVTRNAVSAKLHRIRKDKRAAPSPPSVSGLQAPVVRSSLRADTATASGAVRNVGTSKPLPTSTVITLTCEPVDLFSLTRNGCKWPVSGDGADTMYCGAWREGKRPFCPGHSGIAFVKPRQTKSDLIRNCRRAAG